jgi:hypothetical protein
MVSAAARDRTVTWARERQERMRAEQTFTLRVDAAHVRASTVETVRELGYDFVFEDLAARMRSVLDGQDSSRHVN